LMDALAQSATRETDPVASSIGEAPSPSEPPAEPLINRVPPAQPAEPAIELVRSTTPPAAVAETSRRRPEQEPFQPWGLRSSGPREVLDALPSRSAAAQVSDVLVEVVEAEGPITSERLARLVARAFDLTRVAESRSNAILRHLPRAVRRDDAEKVAWPSHRDPQTWTGFRPSTPEERRLDEIPLREMGNAMRSAVTAAAGMDREELYTEALRTFGFVRRTPSVVARLDRAAELALRDGKMVLDAGLFIQQLGE
jgi:hypothetical protein